MRDQKTFLFAAFILAIVSVANADLSLTINGLDATTCPLEINAKDDLIIASAGKTQADANRCSVTASGGVLKAHSGGYLFTFEDELGIIDLITNNDMIINGISIGAGDKIYELVLFHIPEKDTVIAFGINLEALNFTLPQLGQQIAASQTAEPEKSYSASMSAGRTTTIDNFPETNSYPDLNSDKIVNFVDFAIFANNWQKSGSGLDGDFDNSGAVDTNDLATFAYFWLNGPHPLNVFESFKTALSAGDVNEALTYVAEISREKYAEIFQIIEPNLPDYAAGMGEMIFDRHRFGEVKYEMLHQDGDETLSFPVFFIRDEDGNWRLFNF